MRQFSTRSVQDLEELHDLRLINMNVLKQRDHIIDAPVICQQVLATNEDAVEEVPQLFIREDGQRYVQATKEKQRKAKSLWTIILVFSLHLLLLIFLGQLWSPRELQTTESTEPKPPKLSAYMYYASNVKNEASSTQELQVEAVHSIPPENLVSPRETKISDTTPLESLPLSPKDEDELAELEPVPSEIIKKNSDDKALRSLFNSMENNSKRVAQDYDSPIYDVPIYNELRSKSDASITYFDNKTQRYLTSQNNQRLDNLAKDRAEQFTQTKTLSEMDGEMIILQLPKVDTWSEAKTLDNELDPNRVVKMGDTCYRIVKTPNPINPHAENLGYPFRCDGDSVVESLKRAIAKRTYKSAKN